jgi:multidrug transporter EmrE-like cation transporter
VNAVWLGTMLAVASAGVEGLAQVALKQSSRPTARRLLWIGVGMALFSIEAGLYTAALQRLDVSVAYSLGALSFVAVSLLAMVVLRESISMMQGSGIAFIVAGCALLAWAG